MSIICSKIAGQEKFEDRLINKKPPAGVYQGWRKIAFEDVWG